jgi:SSS family solute:Na+ symporter
MIGLLNGMDLVVFIVCILILLISGRSSSGRNSSDNYFMADRRLPWWSVAGSIYGTNVSLSQIIGMLGIGYSIGFAQSHYEFLAIPAILMLCFVFIPSYRRENAFTLSEYLGDRYNETARLLYSLAIIIVIVILLVGGLYIGSRQLGLLLKGTALAPDYLQGVIAIASIACVLVFFGGMHAVVRAENIITILMVIAVITVGISTLWQPEIGGFSGLIDLDSSEKGMHKMNLYLPSDHPDLPWTGVFSGLLILHGFFWTTNQFEVQRVLAARSDRDAQLGAIAAGFLKLTIPFFSISAGVAAAYLFKYKYGLMSVKPDDAFVYLMGQVVPRGYGLIGLILAGFLGAIFSSIYSMLNSLSTISAIDIYKRYINKDAADTVLVTVGKGSVLVACVIGALLAWWSFDPQADGNFFLVLSKNTSYFKPGIVSAFFLAALWRRVHPASATVAILAAPFLSFGVEWLYDEWLAGYSFFGQMFGARLNFMHRVFIVFILSVFIQVSMSLYMKKDEFGDLLFQSIEVKRVMYFISVQLVLLLLIYNFNIPASRLASLAGILSFLVLINFRQLRDMVVFSSSVLMAITTWALYFFARG